MARLRDLLDWYQTRIPAFVRVALVLVWAGAIWWASSIPVHEKKPYHAFYSHVWNLGHLAIFGVLAVLILLSTQGGMRWRGVFSALLTAIYGLVDERHQGSTKGRAMDLWDAGTDALGACIAVLAVVWIQQQDRRAGRAILFLLPFAAVTVHMASRRTVS